MHGGLCRWVHAWARWGYEGCIVDGCQRVAPLGASVPPCKALNGHATQHAGPAPHSQHTNPTFLHEVSGCACCPGVPLPARLTQTKPPVAAAQATPYMRSRSTSHPPPGSSVLLCPHAVAQHQSSQSQHRSSQHNLTNSSTHRDVFREAVCQQCPLSLLCECELYALLLADHAHVVALKVQDVCRTHTQGRDLQDSTPCGRPRAVSATIQVQCAAVHGC